MLLKGIISINNVEAQAFMWTQNNPEICIVVNGDIRSAYKLTATAEYMFNSPHAKQIYNIMKQGLNVLATSRRRKATSEVYEKGIQLWYSFKKGKYQYKIAKHNNKVTGFYIDGADIKVDLKFYKETNTLPKTIPYLKVRDIEMIKYSKTTTEKPPTVRSLAEISMEKDVKWLKSKKYYIVDSPEIAEKIFTFLEHYKGPIAYDTETTGLKINMFGKYGSKYKDDLEKYNAAADEPIIADKLTGIILCWKPNESYYFPVGHKYIQNLYGKEHLETPEVKAIIQSMRDWANEHPQKDFANYVNQTRDNEFSADTLLMHRVRNILEKGHIVAHNGAFEWKVSYLFDIVINLMDDTMIMHQLMYKYRDTTSNRGESSALKYLVGKEFGIDQLELTDFFQNYSEQAAEVRKNAKAKGKKPKSNIDFSYMNYEGTLAYAPADGDFTLQLYLKYTHALREKYDELIYLYSVEMKVACMIGYMEFSGHRIDEKKIEDTRLKLEKECEQLEQDIRQLAGLKEEEELNLGSPAQMVSLFFERMAIPFQGEKPSVAKNVIKSYLKAKNPDGTPQYPIMHKYSEWKKKSTLITKFFDNLQYYMYPGGFIFSHYGQIAAATGRMSCSKPNAQQYPKVVTKIVIPRDNCVYIDADYSQIEYRVLVGMAQEEYFLQKFKDPDTDYHTLQAANMYGVDYAAVTKSMRSDAKSFNFGIPYGMGFKSLAVLLFGQCEEQHVEEAKVKYEMYFKDQPKVRGFFEDVKAGATTNKYTSTLFNRRRYYRFTDKEGNFNPRFRAAALRQAGNAVIQGTAADIFKIAVARLYSFTKANDLFGAFYVVNMVHDECLMEIDVTKLNAKAMLREVVNCMQYEVEGLPPLYIGAGFDMDWAHAKGGDAELHPTLVEEIKQSQKGVSIFDVKLNTPKQVIDDLNETNLDFRIRKVKNYLLDPANHGKLIHPVIGSMLNTFFSFGLPPVPDDVKDPKVPEQRLKNVLRLFIENFDLDVHIDNFVLSVSTQKDEDEDVEYEDEDENENDADENDNNLYAAEFTLIDESDKLYGVSLAEIIDMYSLIVSEELHVIGIDVRNITYTESEKIIRYVKNHIVENSSDGDYRLVLLGTNNVLKYSPYYLRDSKGYHIKDLMAIYQNRKRG